MSIIAAMEKCHDESEGWAGVGRTLQAVRASVGRAPLLRMGLALAVLLFMVGDHKDRVATRDFQAHREALAFHGGGMLFIAQPMDCLATAEAAELMAASLRADGIPARGLVIKDGFVPTDLEAIMQAANTRFPHFLVTARTVTTFAALSGFAATPIALLVDSNGRVVEAATSLQIDQATLLAERFAARLLKGQA